MRRYQVFVSSTFLDLREERQAVTAALLECDAFPSGMELFPATDDDAWTLIKRVIDESDYYLLVIGGKYGSVDPIEELSYTEMEYDYATAQGKPVMAFLHGAPEKLPVSDAEIDPEKREKLEAFRAKVKAQKHVKLWTTPDGLSGAVALTFNRFSRLYEATGWIRADQATSTESLKALASARAELDELRHQLQSARTEAPMGTEGLSQGDDTFDLPTFCDGRLHATDGTTRRFQSWVRIPTTWNEIIGSIGPKLLQESTEEQIRTSIQEWAIIQHYDFIQLGLFKRFESVTGSVSDGFFDDVTTRVDDEDLGTILVQFKVLGLITHSERRRSVTDTGTYWTLTPYGEAQVMKIRAIRKSGGHAAQLPSSDPKEPTEPGGEGAERVD